MEIIFIMSLSAIFMLVFGVMPTHKELIAAQAKVKHSLLAAFNRGYRLSKKKSSAKEILKHSLGKSRENIVVRSRKNAIAAIAQPTKYRKIEFCAIILGLFLAFLSFFSGFIYLSPVVGLGGYLLPLWLTKFVAFARKKAIDAELEVAISIISSSYLRQGNLKAATSESLEAIGSPVKSSFEAFLKELEISSEAVALEKLKGSFNNSIFKKWCDNLILCGEDKSMSSTIMPIVKKFATQKTLQLENELIMYQPIKQTVVISGITILPIIIYATMGADIWRIFIGSVIGQLIISAAAIVILLALNRAIELCEPIEYNI